MPGNSLYPALSGYSCKRDCRIPVPSGAPSTLYEHMFSSTKTRSRRLTDAVDLLIDFATLGEYGLEPVGRTRQGCADPALIPAPATRRATGRTAARREAQCNLLEEAGFRGPRRQMARWRGSTEASDPPAA